MYVKTLVCLANSYKLSGRCIAGKEFVAGNAGPWVRPVSLRQTGELQLTERWYGKPGTEVQLGHVFRVALLSRRQHAFQTENHQIDPQYHLAYVATIKPQQLMDLVDICNGPLWINGHDTKNGTNDYVPEALAPQVGESLKLLEVDDLKIVVSHDWPGTEYAKRTTRGMFTLSGFTYILTVTDPSTKANFINNSDGTYPIGPAIICISLSEPLNGRVYKLIASVFSKGF